MWTFQESETMAKSSRPSFLVLSIGYPGPGKIHCENKLQKEVNTGRCGSWGSHFKDQLSWQLIEHHVLPFLLSPPLRFPPLSFSFHFWLTEICQVALSVLIDPSKCYAKRTYGALQYDRYGKMWMANYLLSLVYVGGFISVLSGVNVHRHTPHEHGLHSEHTWNQEILSGNE